MLAPSDSVRHERSRADAEHLCEREDDERDVAGNCNSGDGIGAESTNPVKVYQEVESLHDHGHEHVARGLEEVAGYAAACEILHRDRIAMQELWRKCELGERQQRLVLKLSSPNPPCSLY